MEVHAKDTVRAVKSWLEKAGLAPTEGKTDMVFITSRRKNIAKSKVMDLRPFLNCLSNTCGA